MPFLRVSLRARMKQLTHISKEVNGTTNLDKEVLLAWVLQKNKEWVLTHPDYKLSNFEYRAFNKAIERRKKHEPIAYITGTKEFYGQPFFVTKATLIPRPETEELVDEAITHIVETTPRGVSERRGRATSLQVIDIGTGSGNIILSVAMNIPPHSPLTLRGEVAASPPLCIRGGGGSLLPTYTAVDISKKALKIAKKNHKKLCPQIPITFIKSDLLKNIPSKTWDQEHILILANLPYLPQSDSKTIAKDITKFEPATALYSGEEGLDHLTELIQQIKNLSSRHSELHAKNLDQNRDPSPSVQDDEKKRTVTLIAEIDPRQSAILKKQFPLAKIKKDLSKKDRIFTLSF
jgi:release factor glutamine methyltransferase